MENLKVSIVGLTTTDEEVIANTTKEQMEINGGHSANICYTGKTYDEILAEDVSKTLNRAEMNKENRHHSVFGHDTIQLYFDGLPKMIAMMLNNEHEYNTSEKSARYTKMMPSEKELALYNKWCEIIEKKIKMTYPNESYLTDQMIKKKAMENARYMISVMTRTKLKYTTSYRQLNYLYDFTEKMINEATDNKLKNALKAYLEEFRDVLKSTGFISNGIKDYRNREFSLIQDFNDYQEQFGRSYSVNYDATFAGLADLQRHRTLDYNLSLKDIPDFYVPPIIRDDKVLVEMWMEDIYSVAELFPQGMLVNVNETGKYEDFIMKLYERQCTAAQLEVNNITNDVLQRYIAGIGTSTDPRDKVIQEELEKVSHGARCTYPGFKCSQPCGFADGVKMKRKI